MLLSHYGSCMFATIQTSKQSFAIQSFSSLVLVLFLSIRCTRTLMRKRTPGQAQAAVGLVTLEETLGRASLRDDEMGAVRQRDHFWEYTTGRHRTRGGPASHSYNVTRSPVIHGNLCCGGAAPDSLVKIFLQRVCDRAKKTAPE